MFTVVRLSYSHGHAGAPDERNNASKFRFGFGSEVYDLFLGLSFAPSNPKNPWTKVYAG